MSAVQLISFRLAPPAIKVAQLKYMQSQSEAEIFEGDTALFFLTACINLLYPLKVVSDAGQTIRLSLSAHTLYFCSHHPTKTNVYITRVSDAMEQIPQTQGHLKIHEGHYKVNSVLLQDTTRQSF